MMITLITGMITRVITRSSRMDASDYDDYANPSRDMCAHTHTGARVARMPNDFYRNHRNHKYSLAWWRNHTRNHTRNHGNQLCPA